MRYILVKKGRVVARSDNLFSLIDVMGDALCMVEDTRDDKKLFFEKRVMI